MGKAVVRSVGIPLVLMSALLVAADVPAAESAASHGPVIGIRALDEPRATGTNSPDVFPVFPCLCIHSRQ